MARQRRDVRLARWVISLSSVFAGHLASDYGIPPDRISVVPNPIDLDRFTPVPKPSAHGTAEPVTVLFVSRISVRKGVDLVVGLSHRRADLAGSVRIHVIGDRALWSDSRAPVDELNPDIASYQGPMGAERLVEVYARADLLIQPSQYEPFALTVGEALASGIRVVASDEVGATEGVDPRCCTVFSAGDLDAFEAATRAAIARIQSGAKPAMARLARAEAERLFSVDRVAGGVATPLEAALAARDRG